MKHSDIEAIQISNGARLVAGYGHCEDGTVLVVGQDINDETARMFLRNKLAVPALAPRPTAPPEEPPKTAKS